MLAAALATSTAADTQARVRLFQGLGAGAVAVGLLGVGVLVFDYDASAIQATAREPVALPRLHGEPEHDRDPRRCVAADPRRARDPLDERAETGRHGSAGALLMVVSVIASESRGGLLAACRRHARRRGPRRARPEAARLVAVTALVLVFGGGIALAPGRAAAAADVHVDRSRAPTPAPPVAQPTDAARPKATPGKRRPRRAGEAAKPRQAQATRASAPAPKPLVRVQDGRSSRRSRTRSATRR